MGVLWSLAISSYVNKRCINQAGRIKTVINSMQIHPTYVVVLKSTYGALWHLVKNNDANKAAIAATGGSEEIIQVLVEHREGGRCTSRCTPLTPSGTS